MIDYFKEENPPEKKKINKKKLIIVSSLLFLVIILGSIYAVYIGNENFRDMMDQYVFRKNVEENAGVSIDLNAESSPQVYAYDKYICVLERNTLNLYNNYAKKKAEIKMEISSPIFSSNNRFLAVAEKDNSKICLVEGQNLVWEKTIKGSISKINVNKNGYVSIIVTGNTYKTEVTTFNPSGDALFTLFLSETKAIDTAISHNNKYLAIAEVNTTGSLIQSKIEIISMEKAKISSENYIIYTYTAPSNQLITNLTYQEKDKLICMYDDSIHSIQEEVEEEIWNIQEENAIFADINLENTMMKAIEKSTGLFKANSIINFINTSTKKESIYTVDSVPKSIYCYKDMVAINLGTQVEFIATNGWLIKRYTSTQEVKNIVIADRLAGIIYRDKVEIVNL